MKIVAQALQPAFSGTVADYLSMRLSEFQFYDSLPKSPAADELIPIVQPSDFPQIDSDMKKTVDKAKRCAEETLARLYPLLRNESVIEEKFSYLSEPFSGVETGTAVLIQKTNYATVYFLFDHVRVSHGRLRFVKPLQVIPNTPELPSKPSCEFVQIVAEIALSIAKSLGSAILSKVGTYILDQVFKELGLDFFRDTQPPIKDIIHEEVTAAVIGQVNGKVNGTVEWTKNTYQLRKQQYLANPSQELREELAGDLRDYANSFNRDVMGPLMTSGFRCPGFVVFLIGGGTHLALYQERAIMDNVTPSTFVQSIQRYAKDYADFGVETYEMIKNARKNYVSYSKQRRCSSAGGYPVCSEHFEWNDKLTGAREEYDFGGTDNDDEGTARNKCIAGMRQHIDSVLAKLETDLGKPSEVMAAWRNLINEPMPAK